MKTLKMASVLFAIGAALLPMSALCQSRAKPDWKPLGTDEDDALVWNLFYDANSAKRKPKGIVEVWTKQEPASTGTDKQRLVDGVIRNRKADNMPTDGYDKYAYTQTLFEFDCARKKDRTALYRDYDTAGKMIGTQAHVTAFMPVDENSREQKLLEAVCK